VASIGDENAGCAPVEFEKGNSAMSKRRHFKQTEPLKDRLVSFAKDVREQAAKLPPGAEKDDLLRRASQADTAAHLDDWVNSAGLQPPK
jgi:hypothetical protein